MKRIFSLFFLLISFQFVFAQLENPLVEQYYEGLKQLSYKEMSSLSIAVKRYKETFKKSSPAVCDTAYWVLEEFMIRSIQDVEFNPFFLTHPDSINDPNRRRVAQNYQNKLKKQYYVFKEDTEISTVYPDVEAVHAQVSPYVSSAMKSFFGQTDYESRAGFLKGETLLISDKMLAERTLFWDDFVRKYPDFIYFSEAKQRFDVYLETLIFGTSARLPFEGKKSKLRSDLRRVYQWILKDYPLTYTGDIIDRYMLLWEKNNLLLSPEILYFTW